MKWTNEERIQIYYPIVIYIGKIISKIRFIVTENNTFQQTIALWPNKKSIRTLLGRKNYSRLLLNIYEITDEKNYDLDKTIWEIFRDYFQIKIMKLIINSNQPYSLKLLKAEKSFISFRSNDIKLKFPIEFLPFLLNEINIKQNLKEEVLVEKWNNKKRFGILHDEVDNYNIFMNMLKRRFSKLINDQALFNRLSEFHNKKH